MTEPPQQSKEGAVERQAQIIGKILQLNAEVAQAVLMHLLDKSPNSFILKEGSEKVACDIAFNWASEFASRMYELMTPEGAE